jgi:cell division transport system permease protein
VKLRERYDIPFARDGSVRFLPWLIALMVFLASLALAGMLLLDQAMGQWNRGLAGVATVELPPASNKSAEADLAPVLDLLRATPGVVSATPLSREAVAKLVEPWLGAGLAATELALPRLVDVRVDPDHVPDAVALGAKLTALVPGAAYDDSRRWFDRLFELGLSVEVTALAIVGLIGGAAIMTVIFTTRAGLAVHRNVIEILHILGAQDAYIARQFGRQAQMLGLRGGFVGFALAVITLFALGHVVAAAAMLGHRVSLVPIFAPLPWHWSALALLPLATAFIARVTARATVARALARMP